MDIERLIARIKSEERFSPISYFDVSRWSWGYGTLAPGPRCLITEEKAEEELRKSVQDCLSFLPRVFPLFDGFDAVRGECLADMAYNLGEGRIRKFKQMIRAINKIPPDWLEASYQAQESEWFQQVGSRAKRIVAELASGEQGAA
jgi:GH24 family phage-related lysozyme (muramidase)